MVPVIHYIRNCTCRGKNNPCHTVIDNPIWMDGFGEECCDELCSGGTYYMVLFDDGMI